VGNVEGLTDDELLTRLERFVEEERDRLPAFLAWLGEADRRNVPIKRGYSSTFDYCVRRLLLSEGEAYRRIHAARAATSRPELLSAMQGGHLSLTAVSKIAPHVDRKDAAEIIARAEGKSTRELEELLAPLAPEAAKRDHVRTIAVETSGEPTLQTRVEINFQGSPALRDAIQRAKDLLAHKFPFGELEHVLFEVLEDYLERHDPQKALSLGRIAPSRGQTSIPASVRRAVWARDGGRCTFAGSDGIRCQTRRMLELDHRIPRAAGGPDTIENVRLLCRSHNDAERRRLLGEGKLSTNLARAKSVDKSHGLFD
jgi:5-methylcytosine-specific restriction endonuclease McrA